MTVGDFKELLKKYPNNTVVAYNDAAFGHFTSIVNDTDIELEDGYLFIGSEGCDCHLYN